MQDVRLPEIGENIKSGTVTKILIKAGDFVKKGQNILELETDKAVVEIPSPQEGTVSEIVIKASQNVKVGDVIFKISSGAASAATPVQPAKPAASAPAKSEPAPAPQAAAAPSGPMVSGEWKLPELGENIKSGTVTKILVKVGDAIKKGQNLVELETDKAVVEVPSTQDGIIEDILIKQGQVLKVGQPVFKIKGGPAGVGMGLKPTPTTPAAKSESKAAEPAKSVSASASLAATIAAPAKDVAAAPSVRRFAREIGIDITQVPGNGPGGRISMEDVKAFSKRLNESRGSGGSVGIGIVAETLPDFNKWGQVERQAMSNVRRKTAEHLSYAWATIPHVTQFDKADITELEKLRKRLSTPTRKLTITPFLLKVIAAALKNFPQFNTSVDMQRQEIIYKKYINIGVAVDTDRGLLVPVIKNIESKSILELGDELNQIAERARNKKTSLEEMQGGCFTITNLGGIGGTYFTPIVNSPEVAILGVSRGQMEQVYIDNHFAPRLMLPLSLSYDHRVIDGADGARFIRWVCDAIQQPFLMDIEKK